MTSAVSPFLRSALLASLLTAALLAPPRRAAAYCVAHECSLDGPSGDSCVRDPQTGCSSEGVELTRPNGCIQFAVQRGTGAAIGITDAQLEEAILEAFETWAAVDCGDGSPSIEARSVGSVDIAEPFSCLAVPELNVDTWFMSDRLAGMDAITANSGATAGVTRPSFFVQDGEVFDADVLLNELWFLVQRDEDVSGFLHVVALHEAGHALGLAHSFDDDALMHRDYRVSHDRVLTDDDIAGVCALFPPMSLDCGEPTKPPAAFLEDACEAEGERRDDEMMGSAPAGDDSVCSVSAVRSGDANVLGPLGGVLALGLWLAWRRSRMSLALLAALSVAACSTEQPGSGAPADSLPAEDPELAARIADLGKACEYDAAAGRLGCQGGADGELAEELLDGRRARAAALPTIARALASDDPERAAIAAQLLSLGFSSELGAELAPGAVPSSVTKVMLDALRRLPLDQARRITPAAVHAAMLSGQADALFAAIAARRDPELERMAYRRLMVHGRLAPLARIKTAADGQDAQLASAALEALRNMPRWTDAEQQVLCAFAEPYFMGADSVRSARAAQALARCTGPHVETLIARAGELAAEGRLDSARLLPLLDVCKRPADVANGACMKTLTFLEAVLADRSSSPQLRVAALSAIVHQAAGENDRIDDTSPAPELLRRVMETYASDPAPELAKHAQRMRAHFEAMSAAKAVRE